MWIPDSKGIYPDLLATSGDYLRVWRAGEPDTRLECVLNNNKNSDFCAPLTSFDWNEVDPNLVGTSSIDTTCTIWGLETGQPHGRVYVAGHVKTQLIAHDKEVYDIAFSRAGGGRDMFASVGADGSVRMFDLRHLEHSTIIYEVCYIIKKKVYGTDNFGNRFYEHFIKLYAIILCEKWFV